MLQIYDMIDSVADSRATVLITGESGTGKSLVARAIHRSSSRREKPLVEVACGALTETLLESELFGHVAGAFTGATGNKLGKFMQADGGAIFLDEVATASPGMQVKLLRVLEDLEFEQVGGNKTFRVDTRVILATNEDLAEAVVQHRFRHDLFYRINVINIELPPLRQRFLDVPLLAEHFLDRFAGDADRPIVGFTDDAMAALQGYAWPGNVRELENVIRRAVLLGKGKEIDVPDLPDELIVNSPPGSDSAIGRTLKEAMAGPERQIILDALRSHRWNRHATADALGINRTTLYKKMKRLGLEVSHMVIPR
jgi:DNA-binding NtrC family response regulator